MIRNMRKEDIDEIVAIEQMCFNDAWKKEEILNDFETNDLSRYLVEERDGKIAAYIFFWITFDSATIVNLAVKEEYRRQGIAQSLLDECVRMCEAEQVEFLTLEVRVSSQSAIALYEKNGFMQVNIKKAYYKDNYEDASYMVKPLGVSL